MEVATDIFFIFIEKVIIKNDFFKKHCVAYELCLMHWLLIGVLNVGVTPKIRKIGKKAKFFTTIT